MTRVGPRRYEIDVDLDPTWTVLYQFHVSRGRRRDIDARAAQDPDLWRAVLDECIPDPANPNAIPDSHGRAPSSVLDLGAATAHCPLWPPRAATAAPAATVESTTGQPRQVWFHSAPRPDALVVLFDGNIWSGSWPIVPLLATATADGLLPPLAVAMIDAGDRATRANDLAANPAFAADVAAVVEWAGNRVGQRFAPDQVVLCGQSLGGLAAASAALQRPDVAANVLSQSGSFWYPDHTSLGPDGAVQRDVRGNPPRPVRFHIQVGSMERYLLGPNHGLHAALVDSGYDATLEEFGGGHGYPWWYLTMPAGLARLLTPA